MKNLYWLFLFLILSVNKGFTQIADTSIFHLDSLLLEGVVLDKGWKFHEGDDPGWAATATDDSKWEYINPALDFFYIPQVKKRSIGWLRIKLHVDSNLLNQPMALQISQTIASEIYLDGKLLKHYGIVSSDKEKVKAVNPYYRPVDFQFEKSEQILAVRFAIQDNLPYTNFIPLPNTLMEVRINDISGASYYEKFVRRLVSWVFLMTGLFLLLSIIHFGYFLLYQKQKASLFLAIGVLAAGVSNIIIVNGGMNMMEVPSRTYAILIFAIVGYHIYNLFLFLAIHYILGARRNFYFWFLVVYLIVGKFFSFFSYQWSPVLGLLIPLFLSIVELLKLAFRAKRKGQKGVGIIIGGLIFYIVTAVAFTLMYMGILPNPRIGDKSLAEIFNILTGLAIPLTLSAYLSLEFASATIDLEKELLATKKLSEEKQQILATQNETLERQVAERTLALNQSLQNLKSTQSQLIQSEKMASLGELTAGIAHEIQNPLNFVNNFSEVNTELLVEMKDEMSKGNLEDAAAIANDVIGNQEKINHHGKRADAIVKGMLQHSRSSTGQKEPTDINALADEYLRLAYHGLRAKDKSFNATLKTDFDESIGSINIIPQDIGRVLLNLINNSFYAIDEKRKQNLNGYQPTLSVSTKRINNKVTITIADNGDGIPWNILDKIFQPFFTTKPTGEGTGLGLSLSYDIVKAHGGELKVETKEGEGATFIIEMPIV